MFEKNFLLVNKIIAIISAIMIFVMSGLIFYHSQTQNMYGFIISIIGFLFWSYDLYISSKNVINQK